MNGRQHKVVGAGFGIASAMFVYNTTKDANAALLIPTAIAGSMLPDIDHDKTKLGRGRKVVTGTASGLIKIAIPLAVVGGVALVIAMMLGFADYGISVNSVLLVVGGAVIVAILRKVLSNSDTVKWAIKHRGIMHTLVVPALLGAALTVSDFPLYWFTVLGLLVGYVSHLIADMMTVEGCPVLFPLTKNNIHFMSLRTKDKSCWIGAFGLATFIIVIAYLFS